MATLQSYEPKITSINDKIDILNDLKVGLAPVTVSNRYLISIDQILWIEKNEFSILELYRSDYYKLAAQMPLSKGTFPYMENILYQWYLKQLTYLTNAQFLEKARSIIAITGEKQKRGGRTFIGTSSWVTGFKKRHNIKINKRSNNSTSTVDNTQIMSDGTGAMTDIIKNEESTNQSINEAIFVSSSMIQVKIDEADTLPSFIQPSGVNEICVLNPQVYARPIVLDSHQLPGSHANTSGSFATPTVTLSKPPVVLRKPSVVLPKPPVALAKPPVALAKPPVALAKPPVALPKTPVALPKPVTLPKPPVTVPKPPQIIRRQHQLRTRKLSITTPNWAVRVFSQALKWAKENPTDEGDMRVLRKLHNRCVMSLNNTQRVKIEP